jgi:hypothetical protein
VGSCTTQVKDIRLVPLLLSFLNSYFISPNILILFETELDILSL